MSDDTGGAPSHATHDAGREGWLERLIGRFGPKSRDTTRDDLGEILSEATEAGDLSPRERLMLRNVLDFHRVRVSDVMVPRADMIAVAADSTLAEVLQVFRTAGHSRLPSFGETLDEPLGMVHIRDFVDFMAGIPGAAVPDGPPPDLVAADLTATLASAKILRPVLFVPRSMPAIDLLARMQASRTHMALVIDEYGGTDGLVSIEDLLESVVGDIEDEHDETDTMIVHEDGGALVVDARASVEDVSEALGIDLAEAATSDEVDTIGGLITASVGRVPARGELVAGSAGLEFEVLEADPRRIRKVRIRRAAVPAAPEAGAPERDATVYLLAEPRPLDHAAGGDRKV